MREVAGSTPGLDFYLLCEPIHVSLRLSNSAMFNPFRLRQSGEIWENVLFSLK
jgi:hypothetical protein